jgi:prophage maintenance system killer protein
MLGRVEAAQRAVVPPDGDGDVHDCAAALVTAVGEHRPWRRGNRQAALLAVVVLYRLNGFVVPDPDALVPLFDAAAAGTMSTGALCERLAGLVQPTAAASRSPASGPP